MAFDKQSEIKHPFARSERLVIQNIGDETVVYDEDSKTAHALKPVAAAVFMYADGNNNISEIAELASYRLGHTVSESDVKDAVAELDTCGLLQAAPGFLEQGISRRTALKGFGAAAAGTMLVSSVAAPFASASGTNYGTAYLCGTNTSTGMTATNRGNMPTGSGVGAGTVSSWPSVWSSEGSSSYNSRNGQVSWSGTWTFAPAYTAGGPTSDISAPYAYGDDCYVTAPTTTTGSGTCTYGSGDTDITQVTSQEQCSGNSGKGYGFYVNPSGGYVALNTSSSSSPKACVYEYNDTWAESTTSGLVADCAGFFVNSSGSWISETPTVLGTAPTNGANVCVYEVSNTYYANTAVTNSECTASHGICIYTNSANKGQYAGAASNSGSCSSYNSGVKTASKATSTAWDTYVTGTTSTPVYGDWTAGGTIHTGGIQGTYMCVPCDGSVTGASYQCCEPVCVPAGVTPPNTTVETGTIDYNTAPSGIYDTPAIAIWNTLTNYPAKWCTDNNCNESGNCGSSSYS